MNIELLQRNRETMSKFYMKHLVIAKVFNRMGDEQMSSEYFEKAAMFAQRFLAIDCQIKAIQA